MYKIIQIILLFILFCAIPCMALDYTSFINDKGDISPVLLDNAVRDTVEKVNDIDNKKVTYTMFNSSMPILLSNTSAQIYLNKESYNNLEVVKTSVAVDQLGIGNVTGGFTNMLYIKDSGQSIMKVEKSTDSKAVFAIQLTPSGRDTPYMVIYDAAGNAYSVLSGNSADYTCYLGGNNTMKGFTSLGDGNTGVKVLQLTGTTNSAEGGTVNVAHGLTASKIIAAEVLVFYAAGNAVHPNFTSLSGAQYEWRFDTTNFVIYNHATNSEGILSKPISIVVTYIE